MQNSAALDEMVSNAQIIAAFVRQISAGETPTHTADEVLEWADDLVADLATLADESQPAGVQ